MADASNDSLRYPESFNEFLALMERWHAERDVNLRPGESIDCALRRSAEVIQAVTEVARQVWANAEASRTRGVAPSAEPSTPEEARAMLRRDIEAGTARVNGGVAEANAGDQFCDGHCTWLEHAPGCPRAVGVLEDDEPSRTVQCKQCLGIMNEGNGCAQPGCPVGVALGDGGQQ